jgi:hypothetical protein
MIQINFDIKVGRAACEAFSAKSDLSTNSEFALGPKKVMENFDRVDKYWTYSTYMKPMIKLISWAWSCW